MLRWHSRRHGRKRLGLWLPRPPSAIPVPTRSSLVPFSDLEMATGSVAPRKVSSVLSSGAIAFHGQGCQSAQIQRAPIDNGPSFRTRLLLFISQNVIRLCPQELGAWRYQQEALARAKALRPILTELAGMSARGVADELNRRGIPS